jgi:dual specificity protein kinase YAK1
LEMIVADQTTEMNNRLAFIDFVRGLLAINPLERWSPQQAKLHPFITQQKFTGPFVPPMNLKSSAVTKSPAPGVQQQQQAEALSKQRAQAAQAQAQSAAQTAYASMQMNQQYQQPAHAQAPPVYSSMYTPHQQAPIPPYPAQSTGYGHQMGMMHTGQQQMPTAYGQQQQQQQNLYAQATTRAGRQRATTMEHQGGGIPPAIQRVASHLDPNAPIRLQPSPAYYPPPSGEVPENSTPGSRRRGSRTNQGRNNRNFVQSLEDRSLEEGFMSQNQWQ